MRAAGFWQLSAAGIAAALAFLKGSFMLFDSHTHLNSSDFDDRREALMTEARQAGLGGLCLIGSDPDTIATGLHMLADYPEAVMIVGAHPVEAKDCDAARFEQFKAALKHPKVVGVGEIGLDYHWPDSPHKTQHVIFKAHLALAREAGVPFAIHTRDALEDTYAILQEANAGEIGGVIHNFGEDLTWAKRFLDLGLYLSFSGVATFKKTTALREALAYAPLDRILIETDAPYLTPEPFRGQENHPAMIRYTCNRLAHARSMSYEAFAQATYQNALRFYRIERTDKGFVRKCDRD